MTYNTKEHQGVVEQLRNTCARHREHITNLHTRLTQVQADLGKAEARERNLQIELERLKRENAELRSRGTP